MRQLRLLATRTALSVFFSLTIPLAALSIIKITLLPVLLMGVLILCYLVILLVETPRWFPVTIAIGSTIILTVILLLGFTVNRNYLRCAFHAIAALILVFMFKRHRLPFVGNTRESNRISFVFLIVLEVSGLFWVILHGYHGIILSTNSTQKWIGFNIYTIGYLLIGLMAILHAHSLMLKRVWVSRSRFFVDDRDYTPLMGSGDLGILYQFVVSTGHKVTCGDIVQKIETGSTHRIPDCPACRENHNKATLCPDYRRIYNQILKIKKILETLGIGTILQPPNKMNVTREGWRLELFHHVSIQKWAPLDHNY
jgi:hypothetical protein